MTFTVTMRTTGDGTAEGRRDNPPVTIRTERCGTGHVITMLDHDRPIGTGALRRDGDGYAGTCSEFAGEWRVTARVGSAELVFEEESNG